MCAYTVYRRPDVLNTAELERYTAEIEAEDCDIEFKHEVSQLDLDSLLARSNTHAHDADGEDLPSVLLLIDEASAAKGAILVIESVRYNTETQELDFPRAAEARKLLSLPSEVASVAINLDVGNMDWEDFAEAVDADGVFRGFPDPAEQEE